MAETGSGRRIGVIVAHGVGETRPGECVGALVETLSALDDVASVNPYDEVYRIPDAVASQEAARRPVAATTSLQATFPVVVRRATLKSGEELTFGELYWADLTHIGAGRVNAVTATLRVIFEAHYVIDAMLDRPRAVLVHLLRVVLLALSWIMRGPLAALTICAVTICAVYLFLDPKDVPVFAPKATYYHLFAGGLAAVGIANLAVLGFVVRRRDYTWVATLLTTGVVCLAAGAWAYFGFPHEESIIAAFDRVFTSGAPPAGTLINPEIRVLQSYSILIDTWRAWGLGFAVAIVIGLLLRLQSRRRYGLSAGPFTAITILALQFGLWMAVVGTAIIPILDRGHHVVAVNAMKPDTATIAVKVLAACNQVGPPSAKSLSECDAAHAAERLYDTPATDWSWDWVERLKYAYSVNTLILIIYVAAYGVVLRRRAAMARAMQDTPAKAAERLPRLIFNGGAGAVLWGLLVVHFIFGVYLSVWWARPDRIFSDVKIIGAVLDSYRWILGAGAAFFGIVLPLLLGRGYGNALHIARDLIDHHYGPTRGRALPFMAQKRLSFAQIYPRRARIRQRLLAVLRTIQAERAFDKIIFVAHSQGSVVVYDFLNSTAPDNAALGGLKPDVITLGSPLGHIYQTYFPEYADLDKQLERLKGSVGRWRNFYRLDDYIGVRVGPMHGALVENKAMPAGGHTDYWKERTIGLALVELATGKTVQAQEEAARQQAQYGHAGA